jgi:branched-chain amino acid transport system ATP-binding protein
MLELVDLQTYYGDSFILQGVSLQVPQGNVVAILGRNGVGKTTLIHSIVNFVKPRQGKICLEGEEITGKPTHEIMRRGVALVPQGRRVFPSLSVAENLIVPFRCQPSETNLVKQKAGSLSGGEQQMLAIARALVSGPKLMLLDEPSEGLAPLIVKEIAKVIVQMRQLGMAILLVEQNFNLAVELADRIYIMSRGLVVFDSNPEELIRNEEMKRRYLGM